MDLFGDRVGPAFELDFVQGQAQHATGTLAGTLALELDGHLHLHAVSGTDTQEIDVNRLNAECVPLEFADQGASLYGTLQFDDAAAMPDRGLNSLTSGNEIDALFTVAIEHGGHEPFAAQLAAGAGAGLFAELDFNRIAHGNSSWEACHFAMKPPFRKPSPLSPVREVFYGAKGAVFRLFLSQCRARAGLRRAHWNIMLTDSLR